MFQMKYWRKPLDLHKHQVPHGRVHIIDERCKGCGICVEFCPKEVLALAEHYNTKGYHPPRPVVPEACVNCGLCELLCPEFAVYVESLNGAPKKLTEAAAKQEEDKKDKKEKKKSEEAPSHV
jgi:2-oxoglutarate ferredoxin oxidoreductase subunit delta